MASLTESKIIKAFKVVATMPYAKGIPDANRKRPALQSVGPWAFVRTAAPRPRAPGCPACKVR